MNRLLPWIALACLGLLLALGLLLSACEAPGASRWGADVAWLETSFPVLSELRAQAYRNQDWCRNIAYARGRFSNKGEASTCNLFEGPADPFDQQASRDFAALERALRWTGVDVRWVDVEFGRQGGVTRAWFELEAGWFEYWAYAFDPGAPLSEDVPGEETFTRINKDWYLYWGEWM